MTQEAWALQKISGLDAQFFLDWKAGQMSDDEFMLNIGSLCAKIIEQRDRIEALEAALNYVADMTYCGAGAEWHFKLGYDPQEVLDALAPEQEK